MLSKVVIKPKDEHFETHEERQKLLKKFMDQNLETKTFDKTGNTKFIKLSDLLAKNFVGFYFDSKWCLPGAQFLNNLNHVYKESKSRGINFEVVHVSYDTDQKSCTNSFRDSHGDWLLWPYQRNLSNELAGFLSVKYLPCLVVISSNFKLITYTGRKELTEKGFDAVNHWDYINKQTKRKRPLIKF